MEETKIKGLKIFYSIKEMTIENSYQIKSIDKMKIILEEALKKPSIYETKRSERSLLNEWISHNILYKFHLFRKHTKNVNFEKKNKKIFSLLYFLISFPKIFIYKIKNLIIFIKIKKQTKRYNKYIKTHKKNIKKAYLNLKKNPNIYLLADKELLDKLYKRVLIHDDSKYSEEEFEPYRKNFYPISKKEKEQNQKDFNQAWEHHLKNNSHHWQNRQYKENFNIKEDEEVLDVLENILDWIAMGYTFKNTAKKYYEQNKEKIFLCKQEKIFLEHILYDILDEKEGQKWKKKKKKKKVQ